MRFKLLLKIMTFFEYFSFFFFFFKFFMDHIFFYLQIFSREQIRCHKLIERPHFLGINEIGVKIKSVPKYF